MRKLTPTFCVVLLLAISLAAQSKRLWVLRAPGEAAEYDSAAFAAKQTVKVPAEAVASPQNFSVNHLGQTLFAAPWGAAKIKHSRGGCRACVSAVKGRS